MRLDEIFLWFQVYNALRVKSVILRTIFIPWSGKSQGKLKLRNNGHPHNPCICNM